jgi:2-polyprenyl-6-hydroxyphenyl methylase/3-demethylubiquinone-9 3-methyltransferase
MEGSEAISGYAYSHGKLNESHGYLLPAVRQVLSQRRSVCRGQRVFDLGCGNGSVAAAIADMGFDVWGIDPSVEGIRQANAHHPHVKLELGSAYDDLASRYGQFSFVISLEVVEHVYNPRKFAATAHSLLENNGWAIISTPYHGYWKNLALAMTGQMDSHFTALWDHGHIKFWSMRTLSTLLREAGFGNVSFLRVGRIPPLAKSLIAVAQRS